MSNEAKQPESWDAVMQDAHDRAFSVAAVIPKAKKGCELMAALRTEAARKFRTEGSDCFSFGGFDDAHAADVLALSVVKELSGLTVSQARQVLRRAEFWLEATSIFDAEASEFLKADETLLASFGQEVVERQG